MKMFCYYMILLSLSAGLMSSNWFTLWFMMEVNLLAFIPLLSISNGTITSSVEPMKYFLIQALGSSIMFISMLLMYSSDSHQMIEAVFLLSINWKAGVPPFHYWYISIMDNLDWVNFFILSSPQKILPIICMSLVANPGVMFFSLLSMLVGSLSSMYVNSCKKILIYSSIYSMGWVMLSMYVLKSLFMSMFFMYSIMLFLLISLLFNSGANLIFNENIKMGFVNSLGMLFLMLSFAGVPPFIGFFMKLSVLSSMISLNMMLMLPVLVFSSLILMYAYLLIFSNQLLGASTSSPHLWMSPYKPHWVAPIVVCMNFVFH